MKPLGILPSAAQALIIKKGGVLDLNYESFLLNLKKKPNSEIALILALVTQNMFNNNPLMLSGPFKEFFNNPMSFPKEEIEKG